ncbi:hypothetical protein [Polymorphobacter multimanifer]|uniref:Uncharacterized protein n=1 Tax=Polymorphobacter multimanifer TaxID=1070431 RepID=A0A841L5D3_9SPHN|nr:hypothetical protein [Polymorphobacter multimanifer]MBB6227476.1 hypothetical protein [Polymorphobacter multimanifer]
MGTTGRDREHATGANVSVGDKAYRSIGTCRVSTVAYKANAADAHRNCCIGNNGQAVRSAHQSRQCTAQHHAVTTEADTAAGRGQIARYRQCVTCHEGQITRSCGHEIDSQAVRVEHFNARAAQHDCPGGVVDAACHERPTGIEIHVARRGQAAGSDVP